MKKRHIILIITVLFLLLIAGCAPGNERFIMSSAGFWAGLWHGFICMFTFIISLFTDSVHMYEVNNVGGWYDFGFVLGAAIFFGNGCRSAKKRRICSKDDLDWDEIGDKVEEKIRRGIRKWAEESEEKKDEWEEIGRKIEEKIKRELRNWADK